MDQIVNLAMFTMDRNVTQSNNPRRFHQCRMSIHWRSEGGCGPHRAALSRGGKRAKIVFKNSREDSDCIISYVFACKNKALQLQRVPILSIPGYDIDLYFKRALQFPKPETKGRQV